MLIVSPDAETFAHYKSLALEKARLNAGLKNAAQAAARTQDGTVVEVVANIGGVEDADAALEYGAEGVGLFRTEFLYLNRVSPPSEEEQLAAYACVAEKMGRRPLVIRTMDFGGDKPIPYLDLSPEANPFLGCRGIRLGLKYPYLFREQLRAILRASYQHNVKVMFPMVATLEEVRAALELVDQARAELTWEGVPFDPTTQVGIMVEIPAAALLAETLAEAVDFFSIGTNDLTQYTLAADRTNPLTAYLSDALHPAVLRLIQQVVAAAHKKGRWVGLCGELAGDPLAIPILIGLGLDELSMSAPRIPRGKQIIRQLYLSDAHQLAHQALTLPDARSVRETISNWLKEKAIE